jgi:hypothetical protein
MHMDGVRDYLQASPRDEKSINKAVLVASRIPQTSVSLMDLQQFGVLAEKNMPATLLNASAFLARELPIRTCAPWPVMCLAGQGVCSLQLGCSPGGCVAHPGFAHRIAELQTLPFGLAESPSVKKVASWYKQSFADITLAPIPQVVRLVVRRVYVAWRVSRCCFMRSEYKNRSRVVSHAGADLSAAWADVGTVNVCVLLDLT